MADTLQVWIGDDMLVRDRFSRVSADQVLHLLAYWAIPGFLRCPECSLVTWIDVADDFECACVWCGEAVVEYDYEEVEPVAGTLIQVACDQDVLGERVFGGPRGSAITSAIRFVGATIPNASTSALVEALRPTGVLARMDRFSTLDVARSRQLSQLIGMCTYAEALFSRSILEMHKAVSQPRDIVERQLADARGFGAVVKIVKRLTGKKFDEHLSGLDRALNRAGTPTVHGKNWETVQEASDARNTFLHQGIDDPITDELVEEMIRLAEPLLFLFADFLNSLVGHDGGSLRSKLDVSR